MVLASFVPILVSLFSPPPPAVVAPSMGLHLGYASYQGQYLPMVSTQWLGMRYAAPPLGALRFSAPRDPVRRGGIQNATEVTISVIIV